MECASYMEHCVDLPTHILSADFTPDMRVRKKVSETSLDTKCKDKKKKKQAKQTATGLHTDLAHRSEFLIHV